MAEQRCTTDAQQVLMILLITGRRKPTGRAYIPLSGSSLFLPADSAWPDCVWKKNVPALGRQWYIFSSFTGQCPTRVPELEFSSHVFKVCFSWFSVFLS